MLENLPCQPITPIPDLAPNEEGIRPCLRCGKPVRIVQADKESTFCTEVMPKKWVAEDKTLVVYYEMLAEL